MADPKAAGDLVGEVAAGGAGLVATRAASHLLVQGVGQALAGTGRQEGRAWVCWFTGGDGWVVMMLVVLCGTRRAAIAQVLPCGQTNLTSPPSPSPPPPPPTHQQPFYCSRRPRAAAPLPGGLAALLPAGPPGCHAAGRRRGGDGGTRSCGGGTPRGGGRGGGCGAGWHPRGGGPVGLTLTRLACTTFAPPAHCLHTHTHTRSETCLPPSLPPSQPAHPPHLN